MPLPDSLCLMPWIHAHVDAQGLRGLCCMDMCRFDGPVHNHSVEDYWNGEEMRGIRRQMISGRLPPRCAACKGDGNRALSLKDEVTARWPDWAEIVVGETAEDGSTTLRPFTFDYRNSVCNLKCRTCGPHSSTTSEAEARAVEAIGAIERDAGRWDQAYRAKRDAGHASARDELVAAARQGRIRQLYWAGGEPLFDATHWEVMNALVEGGHAQHVDVAYNSNLTLLSFKGQGVEELWPRFRSVHVQASVDGLGKAGEYIRSGFRTETFVRHVDSLRDLTRDVPTIRLTLDVTVTSLGLLYLGDLMQFAVERRLVTTAKLMVPRRINYYMAVDALPPEVARDWSDRWMGWILRHDTEGLLGVVYDVLLHHRKRETAPDPALLSQSAGTIAAFEAARKEAGLFRQLCAVDARLKDFAVPA